MVATMMAGVLLIILGIFKLGTIIKFIPYPIVVGFTSGIAVTIFTTQIADSSETKRCRATLSVSGYFTSIISIASIGGMPL